MNENLSKKYKIVILTNMMAFEPSYSLTGIVIDHYNVLRKYGHDVRLVVNERYNPKKNPDLVCYPGLKFTHLIDYQDEKLSEEHIKMMPETVEMMKKALTWEDGSQAEIIMSHDIIFQGWFENYRQAIQQVSPSFPNTRWLHWVHSVPNGNRITWKIIAKNHKLIYPNMIDALHCAEQFKGTLDDVRVIHHIKDIRVFGNFSDLTRRMCDKFDLLEADIMQTYPMGSDRFKAKGLPHVIKIFENFKKMGKVVRLVICNSWGNVVSYRQQCLAIQKKSSLDEKELVFVSQFDQYEDPKTNELRGKWELGVPARVVRELQMISNLFIFPTREESFGLVLPEAAIMGGSLLVLNKSLDMMKEVSGLNALFWRFGSFDNTHKMEDPNFYYGEIAKVIVGKMNLELGIRAKTFMKKTYNSDAIYKNEIEPLLYESKLWGEN